MYKTRLSKWLRFIIITVGLCGFFICAWVIPSLGQMMTGIYPEFAFCYRPWLILIWVTAIPCYIILALGWRISKNIKNGRSFSFENGKLLNNIAVLSAADAGVFFGMNIVFLFLGMNHPGIALLSLIVLVFGLSVSLASVIVSHLVIKAARLQEENDLTI